MKQFTLHRSERLKKRTCIDRVFKEGRSLKLFPFRVQYLLFPLPETGEPESVLQFGVSVSKRYFKRAVDRNRIKRLVREAYRTQKLPLKATLEAAGRGHLKLFVLYTGKELPAFEEVKGKVATILQRLEREVGGRETSEGKRETGGGNEGNVQ